MFMKNVRSTQTAKGWLIAAGTNRRRQVRGAVEDPALDQSEGERSGYSAIAS
jgi:hypothetical protein